MSAQLIVHKFETGINIKTLHITIDSTDTDLSGTKFSEWIDGKYPEKKREIEKSPRLVVKIISGNEFDKLNLDSCAKEVVNLEAQLNDTPMISTGNDQHFSGNENPKVNVTANVNCYFNSEDRHRGDEMLHSQIYQQLVDDKIEYNREIGSRNDFDGSQSPLEHSLERVRENNARIMENIHMLNRTLNYTKKKEILDIVCPKSMRSFPCNTCGKCFVYETGLRRHNTMRHALTEIQPRWQAVWTCIECFQVWPQRDIALKHSSQCCQTDNVDCVREIKTSSLLQCEFCEKVFTCIPRLLRHSKIHTITNNYECNACDLAFPSYKIAEQHRLICPWLKANYSFSLPKMLLCNACDRKFRNYEQLYNHRYKVGHFTKKTYCNQGNEMNLRVLVHQCELCAQWFSSVQSLQSHRSQYHPCHNTGLQYQVNTNYRECQNNYSVIDNNQGE